MAQIRYTFKIVVDFQSPLSERAIRSRLENSTIPDLDTRINLRLAPHIDGLTIIRRLNLHTMDWGFHLYPKAVIYGDTNKSDDFIEARLDDAHEDMKTILDNDLDAQGASIMLWHRHLPNGECVDELS